MTISLHYSLISLWGLYNFFLNLFLLPKSESEFRCLAFSRFAFKFLSPFSTCSHCSERGRVWALAGSGELPAQEGAAASRGQSRMARRADASPPKHLRRHSFSETRGGTVLFRPRGKRAAPPCKEVPRERPDRWNQQPTHAGSAGCRLRMCQKVWPPPWSSGFPSASPILVHKSNLYWPIATFAHTQSPNCVWDPPPGSSSEPRLSYQLMSPAERRRQLVGCAPANIFPEPPRAALSSTDSPFRWAPERFI